MCVLANRAIGFPRIEELGNGGYYWTIRRVVLTDINDTVMSRATEFAGAIGLVHNVADDDPWSRVISATADRYGWIDVLVNNAGVYHRGPIEATPLSTLQQVIDVNQLGPLLGIRAVAPLMRANGGGAIVNISSTGGLGGGVDVSAYAMSKWALRGLTRCAAAELAPHGIRVNCIVPGLIETDMAGVNSYEENNLMIASTFLGRIGLSREVANASYFLCSQGTSYITGTDLVVDGGLSA